MKPRAAPACSQARCARCAAATSSTGRASTAERGQTETTRPSAARRSRSHTAAPRPCRSGPDATITSTPSSSSLRKRREQPLRRLGGLAAASQRRDHDPAVRRRGSQRRRQCDQVLVGRQHPDPVAGRGLRARLGREAADDRLHRIPRTRSSTPPVRSAGAVARARPARESAAPSSVTTAMSGSTARSRSSETPPARRTDRRGHGAVDDRRLDADVGGAAVDHQVDRAVEVGEHVGGGGRAGAREAIGARRRNRRADRGQQRQRHRMRRHAHCDCRSPAVTASGTSNRLGTMSVSGPGQNERASAAAVVGTRAVTSGQVVDRRQMNDQRIGGRPTLGGEDAATAAASRARPPRP